MNEQDTYWCKKLESSCHFQKESDFDTYSESIEHLNGSTNFHVLERMLFCLNDRDAGEIQYELVEACEKFPIDIYIKCITKNFREISSLSPKWFRLIIQSILNDKTYSNSLISILKSDQSLDKEYVIEYINKLNIAKYSSIVDKLNN